MNYYVSTSGNDANPGTAFKPFRTIAKAIAASSNGDTIHIGAGTYREQVGITKSLSIIGDAAGGTVVNGYDTIPALATSSIDGLVEIKSSNVSITDISVVRSSVSGVVANGVDNISLSGVHILDSGRNGIYTLACDGVDIDECHVSGSTSWSDSRLSDRTPAAVEIRDCANVTVTNSEIHDNDYQGVGIIETSKSDISGCTIYNNAGTQIYLDGASGCSVSGNSVFYTSAIPYTSRAVGIHVARDIYPLIYGASPSTIVTNEDIYITNNVVAGCTSNLIHRGGFAIIYEEFTGVDGKTSTIKRDIAVPGYKWDNVNIINNTFVNDRDGLIIVKESVLYQHSSDGDTLCTFANNIVHTLGKTSLTWSTNDIGTYTFTNNIFSVAPPLFSSLKTLTSSNGDIVGDPLLANIGAEITSSDAFSLDNYAPSSGSPAIDNGDPTVAPVYDIFLSTRAVPDIGAIEYKYDVPQTGGGNVVASFSQSATRGTAPFSISFSDTSSADDDIVSWSWSFGDGGVSSSRNPSHMYSMPGTYSVSLTVRTITGGTASITKQGLVLISGSDVPPVHPVKNRVLARYSQVEHPFSSSTVSVPHGLPYKPGVVLISGRAASSATANGNGVIFHGAAIVPPIESSSIQVGGIGSSTFFDSPSTLASSKLWSTAIEYDNLDTGQPERVFIDWDDQNIYVSHDDDWAPAYSLVFDFIAIGGPDLKYDLRKAELLLDGGNPVNYDSGDIGFEPSAVIAWKEPTIYISDTAVPGYKHHIGFATASNSATAAHGYPNTGSSWQAESKVNNDRLLAWDTDADNSGGISVEISSNGYKLWSTINHTSYASVLAIGLGDIPCLVTQLFSQSAPTSNVVQELNIGFEPQAIVGLSTWMTSNGPASGEASEAHGQFFADAYGSGHVGAFATNYSTSNHGSIGSGNIVLSVPNETEYLGIGLSLLPNGINVTSLSGTNLSGAVLPALIIGAGASGGVVAGFAVDSLIGFVDVPFGISNLAVNNGVDDIIYSYTDGDGNTYSSVEPQISYSSPGLYTITQTVSSASEPDISDTYQVTVKVVEGYLIPVIGVGFASSAQNRAYVGSPVVFSNKTVLQAGVTVTYQSWRVIKVDGNGRTSVVARSSTSPFTYIPQVAANYYTEFDLYLSDGKRGSARFEFAASVDAFSRSVVGLTPIATKKPSGSTIKHNYIAPATVELNDLSGATDVISRQFVIAPSYMKDRIDFSQYLQYADEPVIASGDTICISAGENLRYTFSDSGIYTVALILQTQNSVSIGYLGDFVNIESADVINVGPLYPDTIGAHTLNSIGGDGLHTHLIDVTTRGEPMKVVSTDHLGNITANKFVTNNVDVDGEIRIVGGRPRISADSLVINSSVIRPGDAGTDIGAESSKFGTVNAGTINAANITESGTIGAVGGSLGIGTSSILSSRLDPSDSRMFVSSQDGLNIGDYIVLSGKNVIEIARVISRPEISGASWGVYVERGEEIGDGYLRSSWPAGSAVLNIGGSMANESHSWIEIFSGIHAIASSVIGHASVGPGISGYRRTGGDISNVVNYFTIGDISGMHGVPDDVTTVGCAFGEYSTGGMCFVVSGDTARFHTKDGPVAISVSGDGGILVDIPGENDELISIFRVARNNGIKDVFTIQHEDDIINKVAKTSLTSHGRSGWVSALDIKTVSPSGETASIQIESAWDRPPLIKLLGIPTSDPEDVGALWIDAGTLKVSSG